MRTRCATKGKQMNSKDAKGLSVIAIADGKKVGSVDHLYVDLTARKVVGFGASEGGGFLSRHSGGEELIDAKDVHSVGPDALTLKDLGAVDGSRTSAHEDELVHGDDLNGRKVVTESGTEMGDVASFEFDPNSFDISAVEVSPGLFKSHRMVNMADVLTIGDDALVVHNSVERDVHDPGEAGRFVVGDVEPK